MNKERRAEIKQAVYDFQNAITEAGSLCRDRLESIKDAEQEAFDNLPESIQYGSRGEEMQAVIDALDVFIRRIDDDDFISSETDELFENCGIEGGLYD